MPANPRQAYLEAAMEGEERRPDPALAAVSVEAPCRRYESVPADLVGAGPEVAADGGVPELHRGTTRTGVYYWLDPHTGAALYHTAVNEEAANVFFADETAAATYLEQRADAVADDRYDGLSLYKARTRKVKDATDVLTDQSGIDEFVADGGRPGDAAESDRVWFWYNPSIECIVQEAVAPYDVRGVFPTRADADRFLDWYAEQYGVVDTSHLELYSADVQLEGYGRTHGDGGSERSEEPPEQIDFGAFTGDTDSATGGDAR